MSRMLDALKQIEAKHPQAVVLEPVAAEELVSFGLDRQAKPWAEPASLPETAVVEDVAAEGPAAVDEAIPPAPTAEESAPKLKLHAAPQDSSALEGPADEYAAQYGELAAKILDRCRTERARAFLFTSPGDHEGKTSTLVPVAAVLAERLGEEILLVDANVRQPGIGRFFGLSTDLGLVDVLQGVTDWPEVVFSTTIPHLSVLPGSRIPADDHWSLPPLKFASLLHEWRSRYRLVLIDTPSLIHPFAAAIAKHCEGVYLLVQLGRTYRHAIRQAVEVLEANDAPLLGCVVTQKACG